MSMLVLIDARNHVRRMIEVDKEGRVPRRLLFENQQPAHPTIYVWDGKHANQKRREIFPGYKVRPKPKEDVFANFKICQDVLRLTSAIQIEVPGYEADDVIASLTRHYAARGAKVSITSTDYDYQQLVDQHPGKVFCNAKPKEDVPTSLSAYYKVTVGDSSDRIPGIAGFGEGAWKDADKDVLKAWVDEVLATGKLPPFDWMPKRAKPDAKLIQDYWTIVQFFDVPFDLISQHMTVGTPNLAAGEIFLKQFME